MKYLYIDIDSGTVLNGPIYKVPASVVEQFDVWTDTQLRDLATSHGTVIAPRENKRAHVQFQTLMESVVTERDSQGDIAHKKLITNTYNQMSDQEKAEARAWVTDRMHEAVMNLDADKSRAWILVLDQLKTRS